MKAERTTDLLVVGSGIAGCAAALAGVRAGADVTLATKAARPEDSTSYWAQGGVAVARGDPETLQADIVEASDGLADPEAVDVLVSEADDAVRDVFVDTLDVDFDGDEAFDENVPDGVVGLGDEDVDRLGIGEAVAGRDDVGLQGLRVAAGDRDAALRPE